MTPFRVGAGNAGLLLAVVGASLVPFGHGPWWVSPLLAVAYWGSRTSSQARMTSMLAPLLVAFLASLPQRADLLAFTDLYVRLAASGLLLHFSLQAIEERARRGLWLAAVVWVFAPSPVGLLGLVCMALSFGVFTQRGTRLFVSPRAVWVLAAVALAVPLAGAFVPRVAPLTLTAGKSVASTPEAKRPEAASSGGPGRPAPLAGAPANLGPSAPSGRVTPDTDVFLSAHLLPLALLVVLAVTYLVKYGQGRARRLVTFHWSDVVFVTAALTSVVMALLYILLRTRDAGGGGGGASGGPNALPGTDAGVNDTSNLDAVRAFLLSLFSSVSMLGAVFISVLLLGLIVLVLRARVADAERAPEGGEENTSGRALLPTHRVRMAYARMLEAARQAGVGRAADEAPLEFSRRLSAFAPAAADDVRILTELYLPVRYGQERSEQDAERAEAAAERIESHVRASREAEEA